MQTNTTLTLKDTKTGQSARGPWTLSIFAGGDGREYTTLKGDVASAATALAGQLLTVEYSERQTTKDGRTFTNYNLDGVTAAPQGATAAPAAAAPASGGKGEFRSPQQIIRTSAIEVAASAFLSLGLNPVEDTVGVLTYAALVEAFITEGIEEEPEA